MTLLASSSSANKPTFQAAANAATSQHSTGSTDLEHLENPFSELERDSSLDHPLSRRNLKLVSVVILGAFAAALAYGTLSQVVVQPHAGTELTGLVPRP